MLELLLPCELELLEEELLCEDEELDEEELLCELELFEEDELLCELEAFDEEEPDEDELDEDELDEDEPELDETSGVLLLAVISVLLLRISFSSLRRLFSSSNCLTDILRRSVSASISLWLLSISLGSIIVLKDNPKAIKKMPIETNRIPKTARSFLLPETFCFLPFLRCLIYKLSFQFIVLGIVYHNPILFSR